MTANHARGGVEDLGSLRCHDLEIVGLTLAHFWPTRNENTT